MISLYYGKIGDGKTYHVVANELLPAIQKGRKVYTNIDGLNIKYICMFLGILEKDLNLVYFEDNNLIKELLQIEPGDKEGLSLKIEKGSIIIIDEAQMIWDAREFKDTKKGFLTLLEYHRHFGLDFVFITQNPKRLETSITRLSNEAYQVKNLGFLGGFLKGRYVIHVRQTPYDRDIVSTIRGKYRPEIFQCYRSYVVTSKGRNKPRGALQGFFYYATAIILILSVALFVIRGGFSFANPKKVQEVTKKGGQNDRDVSKATDFIYSNSSSQKAISVSNKEEKSDIIDVNNDCSRYSGSSGKDYFKRFNTVLIRGSDGVWRNEDLNCSDEKQEL
ncbi:hypothetical protein A45J_2428 [hot springs metagenome]|uniref:Zona occludens toxin N-terminal domain-containing protein n=1 Tax=hot springs metagenome TaxID=433727 RepID=A0A5J4KZI9_9ZZZZ